MNRKPLHSHVLAAKRYADAVVSGEIDACRFVKSACARHLSDLERQRDAAFPYRFDPVAGEKVCKFAELLPHIKGEWAGKLIKLEPWQSFILSTLFGWVRKTDGKRRFRELYAEIPRKNGKSVFGAVIGLYMFTADGEAGAEVYSGATTEKQAWEVFRPAKLMATRADGFAGHFGVQVNASNMAIVDQAAKFEPIIGNPGDGASPHCAIIDEYHEHRTPDQYDTMITGMGARLQPLTVIITTAGTNLSGPCYDKRATVVKLLDGVIENEELFAIIYTLDDDDDWTDFTLWRKANPNYGVSVYEDYLRARHREAIQQASRQNIIQCKH
jgi:phage terminase large subunit-like protein